MAIDRTYGLPISVVPSPNFKMIGARPAPTVGSVVKPFVVLPPRINSVPGLVLVSRLQPSRSPRYAIVKLLLAGVPCVFLIITKYILLRVSDKAVMLLKVTQPSAVGLTALPGVPIVLPPASGLSESSADAGPFLISTFTSGLPVGVAVQYAYTVNVLDDCVTGELNAHIIASPLVSKTKLLSSSKPVNAPESSDPPGNNNSKFLLNS